MAASGLQLSSALLLLLFLPLLLLTSAAPSYSVTLRVQQTERLLSLFLNVSSPSHPQYRQFLSPAELHDAFAPSAADVEAVKHWLGAEANATLHSGRRWRLDVVGPMPDAGLSVPPELQRVVRRVWSPAPGSARGSRPRVVPVSGASVSPDGASNIVVAQSFSTVYGAPNPLTYTRLNSRRPLSILAVSEGQAFYSADLTAYTRLMGRRGDVRVNSSNLVLGEGLGDLESTLDMEMIASVSPQGTQLRYYNAAPDPFYDLWCQDVLNLPQFPLVVTTSFAASEDGGFSQQADANGCLQLLGAGGVSVVAASGDNGAYGLTNPSCSAGGGFSVEWPASSAYCTAVGATVYSGPSTSTMAGVPVCSGRNVSSLAAEFGFSSSGFSPSASFACVRRVEEEAPPQLGTAGFCNGGGFSYYESLPSWQSAAVNAYTARTDIPFPADMQVQGYPLWSPQFRGGESRHRQPRLTAAAALPRAEPLCVPAAAAVQCPTCPCTAAGRASWPTCS